MPTLHAPDVVGLANGNEHPPQISIEVKTSRPSSVPGKPIYLRLENQVTLDLAIRGCSANNPLPWDCLQIPFTKSVKKTGTIGLRTPIQFSLEVRGATTGKLYQNPCEKCAIRDPRSATSPLVDFVAKDTFIDLKGGRARIPFRFLCYSHHQNSTDTEYRLDAVLHNGTQVVDRCSISDWFRVKPHGNRVRNIAGLGSEQQERRQDLPMERFFTDGAIQEQFVGLPFPNPEFLDLETTASSTDDPSSGPSSAPPPRTALSTTVISTGSESCDPIVSASPALPVAEHSDSPLQTDNLHQPGNRQGDEEVNEESTVLSLVCPSRGPTSGGEQVVLLVEDLPSSIKFYVRFGDNFTAASRHPTGALICNVPPAAHPGTVRVTLSRAPSVDAPAYGKSLANFTYEADSTKAAALLFQMYDGRLLEAIERVLQRELSATPRGGSAHQGLRGSNTAFPLDERAFMTVLNPLISLPNFKQRLDLVNAYGQTLLHLAIHLRYRALVRRLIEWGIDLHQKDINGFTALHCAHLCGDWVSADYLQRAGATVIALDGLGRSPVQLSIRPLQQALGSLKQYKCPPTPEQFALFLEDSRNAPQVGISTADFTYFVDTTQAIGLLLRIATGQLLWAPSTWIQRPLPPSTRTTDEMELWGESNDAGRSSSARVLLELAFLEIHSSISSVPDFFKRLSTINEYEQSLLHFAVHLLHRQPVQQLVDWRVGSGVQGISSFAKLHCASICEGDLVVKVLQRSGAFLSVFDVRSDPNLTPESMKHTTFVDSVCKLPRRPRRSLVFVIDALDECDNTQSFLDVLKALTNVVAHVQWLKVIITSRPDVYIEHFFNDLPQSSQLRHDLTADEGATSDLRTFALDRFSRVALIQRFPPPWPQQPLFDEVVSRAAGLFIFIETIALALEHCDDPTELLKSTVRELAGTGLTSLHGLYSNILEAQRVKRSAEFQRTIRVILTTAPYRPLREEAIAELAGVRPDLVKNWAENLSSPLCRDQSADGGIRVRHLSISEFFVSDNYRSDLRDASVQLGIACLKTMVEQLHFNICKLEDSRLANADVEDLPSRINKNITDALQCSSLYWSNHPCSIPGNGDPQVVESLMKAFQRPYPLFGIEVLSITGVVPIGAPSLRKVISSWGKDVDQALLENFQEICRFITTLDTTISISAPLTSLSTGPFLPLESPLSPIFSKRSPKAIRMQNGKLLSWPAPPSESIGNTGANTSAVNRTSNSPDGSDIAATHPDQLARFYDAETGPEVGKLREGHHISRSWSVAYSPDGQHITTGSWHMFIRIWEAKTGATIGKPLQGHTTCVLSVAYSPDGQPIVSGSHDKRIRIWDAEIGAAVGKPLEGHTGNVLSIAYSPDGRHIISGSGDGTIRIWDAVTGSSVGKPLKGHTGGVQSATYSPNGRYIISGSWDRTTRIWDAETGSAIGKPLEGYTGSVLSVAYSPDGRCIVSGSRDRTIRIWDAETGSVVGQRVVSEFVMDRVGSSTERLQA